METAALTIAKQWHWPKAKVKLLQEDLKKDHKGVAPFAGSHANVLNWWESLIADLAKHPFKAMAITLHSIVP